MSHLPLRKENNCLNCGAVVTGRFCSVCGQENTEPKETVWYLIVHFFNDITHFDGKFFSSVRFLLFSPGFLSGEYMNGRRASYLNPVRMYIFTSFIFFLVFFSLFTFNDNHKLNAEFLLNGKTASQINSLSPAEFNEFTKSINNGIPMSREEFKAFEDSIQKTAQPYILQSSSPKDYQTRKQYDSAIRSGKINPGWLKRQIEYKQIEIHQKYGKQEGRFISDFIQSLMHHFPQLLFVSLPLLALILQLLYIRRKKFYYVSHAIFTIHLYIFAFIAMLLMMGFQELEKLNGFKWLNIVNNLLTLLIFFYVYKAMRNFYEQKRFKTIIKYLLFITGSFITIVFLFAVFALISFVQI